MLHRLVGPAMAELHLKSTLPRTPTTTTGAPGRYQIGAAFRAVRESSLLRNQVARGRPAHSTKTRRQASGQAPLPPSTSPAAPSPGTPYQKDAEGYSTSSQNQAPQHGAHSLPLFRSPLSALERCVHRLTGSRQSHAISGITSRTKSRPSSPGARLRLGDQAGIVEILRRNNPSHRSLRTNAPHQRTGVDRLDCDDAPLLQKLAKRHLRAKIATDPTVLSHNKARQMRAARFRDLLRRYHSCRSAGRSS